MVVKPIGMWYPRSDCGQLRGMTRGSVGRDPRLDQELLAGLRAGGDRPADRDAAHVAVLVRELTSPAQPAEEVFRWI
jgi:hypothetical protein